MNRIQLEREKEKMRESRHYGASNQRMDGLESTDKYTTRGGSTSTSKQQNSTYTPSQFCGTAGATGGGGSSVKHMTSKSGNIHQLTNGTNQISSAESHNK